MTSTQTEAGRRVVAQISTTLDGRVSGPKGPSDMEVVARYAGEQVDRLLIDLVPEVAGGGAKLFEDGLPPSSWSLTDAVTADDGALLLTYDR